MNKNWNKLSILTLVGFLVLLLGVFAFLFFGGLPEKPIYLFLLLGIAAVIIIIALIYAILVAKGKIAQKEPDYRAFFIIGITWIPLGIIFENYALLGAAVVFMVIGLTKKDRWKNQPKWSELSSAQRNFKLAAIILLGIAVLVGLVAWYMAAR